MRVLLRKLRAGRYYSLISRFAIVRRGYSAIAGMYRPDHEHSLNSNIDEQSVIFDYRNPHHYASRIKCDAFVQGLALSPELVGKLYQYASVMPCRPAGLDRSIFMHEVSAGKLQTGETILSAHVEELEQCAAVGAVERDAFLLRVATLYLGYRPSKIKSGLWWSFCSNIPACAQWEGGHSVQRETTNRRTLPAALKRYRERLKFHLSLHGSSPVYHHFDVCGYNSVRAYFYITDVDRYSGAHAVIRASHSKKTFRMLMSSGVYPESRLLSYYGPENEFVIEGPAGFGFIEDVACYHKLLPPTKADRLILSVTYS